MRRRRSHRERGVTLVETMIALIVLSTGVAAVFGMVTHVTTANRSLTFQANSLDVFARVAAQIQDTQCDFPTTGPPVIDPGLLVAQNTWITAPVGNSAISFIGVTDGVDLPELTQPKMRIEYQLSRETPGPPTPDAFNINVRVREITNDPVKDALGFAPSIFDGGHWIRVYPVKKVCVPRVDDLVRGYN
jgi:type II secretory pathway pseudopilin PulG